MSAESSENLPTVSSATSPTMYCAGCGSKVGSDVLTRALQRLEIEGLAPNWTDAEDILVGLTAPDDAAVVQVPAGKLMVHTVDFFTALVSDPFVFAQIVVKHCLNDLYAMGAEPQSVLAMATLPYAIARKQTETLFHLLSGVQTSLAVSKTPIIGGHTTEGADLMLGLACNGLVAPGKILRKQGMQVGDALILTQPLGTGTLFAADMQKAAKGRWIENAIAHMTQSNEAAMQGLRQYGITACTDVSGFGLLGHLLEMVQASQVDVELELQDLPLLLGAEETLQQGIVSSLHPQNVQAARSLKNAASYASHPAYPILFDPQTAGGLLASVPGNRAADCVAHLRKLGYTATCIGSVVAAARTEPPVTIKSW